MSTHNAKRTLGYVSQSVAIVALYDQGICAPQIAKLIGRPRGSVHRALHEHREREGIMPPAKAVPPPTPAPRPKRRIAPDLSYDPHDAYDPSRARLAAYRLAQHGARQAMEAAKS